jgi:hypothetical protein
MDILRGYRYGTQWLKRELPPEIVQLAETICGAEVVDRNEKESIQHAEEA